MPDPLRAKLVSESASGMASASISPPGPFHSRILTGFGRARLLPSLFISPRLRTGSAGASPSRENETALSPLLERPGMASALHA